MDAGILKKCRYAAVEEDLSLSQWIASRLVGLVDKRSNIYAARSHALKRMSTGFSLKNVRLTRDSLHER